MSRPERKEKLKLVAQRRQQGAVVIEDVYDPHNAAAVFRSCEAFGIQKVFLIFEKQKKFNPKKVGKATSSSANKWLDFTIFDSTKKCLASLKRQGYTTVATVLDRDSESMYKAKLTEPKLAWLFGNEHAGLSEYAIKHSDLRVFIPMQGLVQSLNLSVTAGICLFET